MMSTSSSSAVQLEFVSARQSRYRFDIDFHVIAFRRVGSLILKDF